MYTKTRNADGRMGVDTFSVDRLTTHPLCRLLIILGQGSSSGST